MTTSKPVGIGHGNYVPVPVVETPATVRVHAGQKWSKVAVVTAEDRVEKVLGIDRLILEEGAEAEVFVVVMPGADADISIEADLLERGANVRLSGIYLCSNEENVKIRTNVCHLAPDCTSYQEFNGIAGGHGKVGFFGTIIVAPDAQKTEAYQTNRNILLDKTAIIDTKPQLEIYADDVKCSHGATIGCLNEDEQFYMRSRGIPESEARVLQMISFIAPVVNGISDVKLREEIMSEVESAVREMGNA